MAKIIEDSFTRERIPQLLGLTFVPKYWSIEDEDQIWCECVEHSEHSGYLYYAFLDSWRIEE